MIGFLTRRTPTQWALGGGWIAFLAVLALVGVLKPWELGAYYALFGMAAALGWYGSGK